MRIIITSDLNAHITGKEPIRRMVAGISHAEPDLVVIAGNLGTPSRLFEDCLSLFVVLECPVAVIPGQHDLWCHPREDTNLLYQKILPGIVRDLGFVWLDSGGEPFVTNQGIGIAGSIGWYDTRVQPVPKETSGYTPLPVRNSRLFLNWDLSDNAFANKCEQHIADQLRKLDEMTDIERILVVTHFPLFEHQVDPRLEDSPSTEMIAWHRSLGERVMTDPKARWVVSGCVQTELHGVAERKGGHPIATAVVGSKYYKPRYLILDTE